MKRDDLLAELRVLATAHYGQPPDPLLEALLAKVVINIPDDPFEPKTPLSERDSIFILGEIDTESSDKCIDDLMEVHLNRPIERPIHLIISSEGGEVEGGMAICSTISQIRREKRLVRAHVAGVAFSAAFDILQMCDHRSAEPTAFVMVHEDQFGTEGSTSSILREAKFSKKQVAAFLRVLSQRTGKTVDFYQRKIDSKNWYLGADEALDERFIDEIIAIPAFPPPPQRPTRTPRRTRQTQESQEA